MQVLKCNECKQNIRITEFKYYSKHLRKWHIGKRCRDCRKAWGNEMKVKKEIKKQLTAKYPDIINEIYNFDEND